MQARLQNAHKSIKKQSSEQKNKLENKMKTFQRKMSHSSSFLTYFICVFFQNCFYFFKKKVFISCNGYSFVNIFSKR